MPKIKFSHAYEKLLDCHNDWIEEATLLEVLDTRLERLHPSMIDYDTDGGKFKLPKSGQYLMLIFLKPNESHVCDKNLFTTIRRWTASKQKHYDDLRGEVFDVVIEEVPA